MHLDDTPIKVLTEIIVLGKLLKETVWSKSVRRFAASLFKKINSVPRGIFKDSPVAPRVKQVLFQKNRNRLTIGSFALGTTIRALKDVDIVFTCVDNDHMDSSNLNRLLGY